MDDFDQNAHEQVLQQLLVYLLTQEAGDLQDLCEQAGIPALFDEVGQPVYVTDVATYEQAGVLTTDFGVQVDLSDGSQFGFTITIGRRPRT